MAGLYPQSAEERSAFRPIAEDLSDLAARLQHRKAEAITKQSTRSVLFDLLVQIRNNTVHGAYESRFYADHVGVVESAVQWLLRETPLWEADLIEVMTRNRGRLLRGSLVTQSASLNGDFDRDDVAFCLSGEFWRAVPLIRVRDGHTYFANGSWRPTDSSAEFLCHSLAAREPGQGTIRVALPALARPPLPTVGQTVDGQYKILRILGEGEDAVVYLACHTAESVEYVLKAFRTPSTSAAWSSLPSNESPTPACRACMRSTPGSTPSTCGWTT